ncbi:MAG: domain S-box protein [Polaromonas sp.]|nr:domain S-box protein [Polaromonas sp.]
MPDALRNDLKQSPLPGSVAMWERNLLSGAFWYSAQTCQLFGLAARDFDGAHDMVRQCIHPDDMHAYERQRQAADASGAVLEIEYRIAMSTGELRWIRDYSEARCSSAGVATVRCGFFQDITPIRQAEQAAFQALELLGHTADMAKVGGWQWVVASRELIWSDQVYALHEIERTHPVSLEDAVASYAPEARPVIGAAIQAALDHGTAWDLELPLLTAKGRRIYVRTQGQAMQAAGKVTRLVGAFQDITERHEAETQQRLLQTCISRLTDIVLITEAEPFDEPGNRIVFVNDAFERRTGYGREEVMGRSTRFLQGPKTQRSELKRVGEELRKWRPVHSELINYTKSGEEFWIEMDIAPVANDKGRVTHWIAIERDITQRKLAEQALQESEQRYAALFAFAPVPMWVFDVQSTKFLAVNNAAVATYGFTVDEFLAMTLLDIHPETEYFRFRKQLQEPMLGKNFPSVHRLKDGTTYTVNIFWQSIEYKGRAACFAVVLDVENQARAEAAAREHLFTLQRAADAAQAITWHQSLDGTLQEIAEQARGVIGANLAMVTLAGGAADVKEAKAVSLSEKYQLDYEQILNADSAGLYDSLSGANGAVRKTRDELARHFSLLEGEKEANPYQKVGGWLAVPLMSRAGKKIGLLELADKFVGEFTLEDQYVTLELAHLAAIAIENAQLIQEVSQLNAGLEQKVAERTAALARQEALFRALTEQAPQIVWTVDRKGQMTYVNQAWFRLVGGTHSDWAGTNWLSNLHPEDKAAVKSKWQIALAGVTPYEGIRRIRDKNGYYHTMSYRASPVLDEKGEVLFWVGIDADITEIKTIEAALRLSNQELEAFSYSVSHDLRSPLNTINGFSSLLAKQLGANSDVKVQHYLSRIQSGAAQMGRLIEDLLSLAQVSRLQLRHERVDLSAMANRILEEWRTRNPARKVMRLVEEGLTGYGDARLLRVLMENLLGNAWKFTSQRAMAEIRFGQTVDEAGGCVFHVVDNGCGFDMAFANKLFVPFQRLHDATEFPGSGIGLATVSRVINRHQGKLWVESTIDVGTTIFFTLPRSAALDVQLPE